MFKLLFSSRWLALIWGAGMVGSAAMFVGEGGTAEQLGKTVEKVAAQKRELAVAKSEAVTTNVEEPADPPTFEGDEPEAAADVFINPETGQRVRIVRRLVTESAVPASHE